MHRGVSADTGDVAGGDGDGDGGRHRRARGKGTGRPEAGTRRQPVSVVGADVSAGDPFLAGRVSHLLGGGSFRLAQIGLSASARAALWAASRASAVRDSQGGMARTKISEGTTNNVKPTRALKLIEPCSLRRVAVGPGSSGRGSAALPGLGPANGAFGMVTTAGWGRVRYWPEPQRGHER